MVLLNNDVESLENTIVKDVPQSAGRCPTHGLGFPHANMIVGPVQALRPMHSRPSDCLLKDGRTMSTPPKGPYRGRKRGGGFDRVRRRSQSVSMGIAISSALDVEQDP